MKKFSILALVLAFTMMLSVVSFAADPAFQVVEREDAAYDPEVTEVTAGADSIAVSTDATKDAYYGVLLINGSALPTVDDNILYIDQKTATGDSVEFTVLPIIPDADLEKDLTLYISSNASGEDLIVVPVAYGVDAPAYTIGDINNDGYWNSTDATKTLQIGLKLIEYTETEALAADVNEDGYRNSTDATKILQYGLKLIDSWK